jgi:hypothetical protein
MKSPVDDVVLQGIEFWTTICEEEMTLQMEAEDVSVLALVVAYALTGNRSWHDAGACEQTLRAWCD